MFGQPLSQGLLIGDGLRQTVAADLQPFNQGIAVDTFDRLFSGDIDRRHENHVGVVESGLKFFHMIAQTGETMWLDHGDHAAFRAFACC